MTVRIKQADDWKPVKDIYTYQQGTWSIVKSGYIKQANRWQNFWQNIRVFTNNSPQTSLNIFEVMGKPKHKGNYLFINNAEIIANNGETALVTGRFPQGSSLTIINNSYIIGHGGNGGSSDSSGQDGGDAILLEMTCRIDNSNGYIYAGGGGGGGINCLIKEQGGFKSCRILGGGAGGYPNGKCGEPWTNIASLLTPVWTCKNATNADYNSGNGGTVSSLKIKIINNLINQNLMQLFTGSGGEVAKDGEPSTYKMLAASTMTIFSYTFKKQNGGKAGLAIRRNGHSLSFTQLRPEQRKGDID